MTPQIEIRRSARRKRTIQAYRKDGRVIILMPAGLSAAVEKQKVAEMVAKVEASENRTRLAAQHDLWELARRLSETYLEGRAQPTSLTWVDNMTTRWASCTASSGAIRLSERLLTMPAYVIECVLLHELAHLLVPNHSPAFHALADAHPRQIEAEAFLQGVAFGLGMPAQADDCDG